MSLDSLFPKLLFRSSQNSKEKRHENSLFIHVSVISLALLQPTPAKLSKKAHSFIQQVTRAPITLQALKKKSRTQSSPCSQNPALWYQISAKSLETSRQVSSQRVLWNWVAFTKSAQQSIQSKGTGERVLKRWACQGQNVDHRDQGCTYSQLGSLFGIKLK